MSQAETPAGFVTYTVDVRIIRGRYVPCIGCHWYGVCAVPESTCFPKYKEYFGSDDIHYHNNDGLSAGRSIFTCLEYTVRPK